MGADTTYRGSFRISDLTPRGTAFNRQSSFHSEVTGFIYAACQNLIDVTRKARHKQRLTARAEVHGGNRLGGKDGTGQL